MPFTPVYYSQQDPAWKNVKIGFSHETIGHVGCALTSVAMLLSGHGFPETPESLNKRLKNNGGFVDAAIVWSAVSAIYPQIKTKPLILCYDTDAPLAQIDAALAAGQPVIVQVDSSPAPGLQTHWVVLYARQDNDYLILDPWPYPPESGKNVLLMSRYSQGKPLKKTITAVVMYECPSSGGTIPLPPPPATTETNLFLQVSASAAAGLRLRNQPTLDANTLTIEPPGTRLRVIEPESVAEPKIGVYNQWIRVRDPNGQEGYVAAWFVERATPVEVPPPPPSPEPPPPPEPPAPPPSPQPEEPAAEQEKLVVMVSSSVGASGLRLRQQPSLGGALITVLPAGERLTVLEKPEVARPKIGKANQWLYVRDSAKNRGYVSAQFVREAAEETPPAADEIPPAGPPTAPLMVTVSSLAAAGLRLRKQASLSGETITILPPKTLLLVLEDASSAGPKIGVYNEWLQVREPGGKEGYVAAWYVKAA